MRSQKNILCDFHQNYEHGVLLCIALNYQLANLVKEYFLTEYLEVVHEESKAKITFSKKNIKLKKGLSGGGSLTFKCKYYVPTVILLDTKSPDQSFVNFPN